MTRVPDAVTVASLDTHRLIVTVPNDGPADVSSSLPRATAADVLRQIADQLAREPRSCGRARSTGQPCPIHDRPTPARPDHLDQQPADDSDRTAAAHALTRHADHLDEITRRDRAHCPDALPHGAYRKGLRVAAHLARRQAADEPVDPAHASEPELGELFAAFGRKLRSAVEEDAAEQAAPAVDTAQVRAAAFEEAATIAEQVAAEMRECDGTWPEEWSSRDVRDAVESAAGRIRSAAKTGDPQ
ncbi:hypothetical protein [Streptomyces montanisoli]|uniref:Uncharacterized protein n=1 Tax=Streptomyces montanisoli TaxID=2798581 RepID=A0A940RVM3_9ACTN|nr:hypothetical protein [Streptomyces montanisoli]MBP0456233.1 hypothetical protein [Streptomyces montanisoli]